MDGKKRERLTVEEEGVERDGDRKQKLREAYGVGGCEGLETKKNQRKKRKRNLGASSWRGADGEESKNSKRKARSYG